LPAQHSASAVHLSPVGLQADFGTSQVPVEASQLSEQQSVSFVHFWWKERHVAQLTPTKHAVPKQQPLAHVDVLQTQTLFTQA
jgi:hypothetical protein